jgi:hypothetical protein
MIPFKGPSSIKQYLPLKPVKRGFKVWAMADALNGYLYDFNVYTGATPSENILQDLERISVNIKQDLITKSDMILHCFVTKIIQDLVIRSYNIP